MEIIFFQKKVVLFQRNPNFVRSEKLYCFNPIPQQVCHNLVMKKNSEAEPSKIGHFRNWHYQMATKREKRSFKWIVFHPFYKCRGKDKASQHWRKWNWESWEIHSTVPECLGLKIVLKFLWFCYQYGDLLLKHPSCCAKDSSGKF